jgi:hypothetical protein
LEPGKRVSEVIAEETAERGGRGADAIELTLNKGLERAVGGDVIQRVVAQSERCGDVWEI